jgi:hypothetical protein
MREYGTSKLTVSIGDFLQIDTNPTRKVVVLHTLIFNRNTACVSQNLFGVLLVNISTVKYFRVLEKNLLKYLRHTFITKRKRGEPPGRLLIGPNN